MAWRSLTPTEQAEAFVVFAGSMEYARIRVSEDARWANALPRLRARLSGRPAPAYDNAVTLGHRLCFPRRLDTSMEALTAGRVGDFGWLIHELTHAWQAERIGVRYLWRAVAAQVREGDRVYDFGGEDGLREAALSGSGLLAFNVEQQAEIARGFYMRLRRGTDVTAWTPILASLSRPTA